MGQDNDVSYDIEELKERVRTLEQAGRFRTALDQLFPILDKKPDDTIALQLASIVLYVGSSSSRAYDAIEPLTDAYFNDTRLDPLFCQCEQCGAVWVPTPFASLFSKMIASDGPGGICSKCHKVFCRQCSRSYAEGYKCPNCDVKVLPIKEPNGRKSLQMRKRKEKLELVLIFREGPVPPDSDYLTKLLRDLSPDVFETKPRVKAQALFPWPEDKLDVLREALAICAVSGVKIPNANLIDDFFAVDEDGNNFCLFKIYR